MLAAALSPKHGAETWAVHDGIMLEVARKADIAFWDIELWAAEPGLRSARPFAVCRFTSAGDGFRIQIFVSGHLSLSDSLLGRSFLSLAGALGFEIVLADGNVVFDAGSFLSLLAIVPAFEGTDEVASNTAETFEAAFAIAFFAAAVWTGVALDDAREATDWIAVNWVVDRAVADATIVHFADDSFESGDVLRRVTIELDVGNVTGVTKIMIRGFDFDFVEGADWIVDWYVEGIGVEFPVGDAFDFAEFFAIDFGEATGNAFGWSGKKAEVEFVLLAVFIAFLTHMSDDI
jgi:hypothetical protein